MQRGMFTYVKIGRSVWCRNFPHMLQRLQIYGVACRLLAEDNPLLWVGLSGSRFCGAGLLESLVLRWLEMGQLCFALAFQSANGNAPSAGQR